MKHGMALTGLLVALIFPVSLWAAEKPYWSTINNDVQKNLLDGKWDLCDIAKELAARDPKNATEAMTKLSVMLRAGMDKEAIKTIGQFKQFTDEIADYQADEISASCLHYQAWDVTKALWEAFPAYACNLYPNNGFLLHLSQNGWSVEDLDKWLTTQYQAADKFERQKNPGENYRKMAFINHFSGNYLGSDCWMTCRIKLLTDAGKEQPLVAEFERKIQENPNDTVSMLYYLKTLRQLSAEKRKQYDAIKIANVYKPLTAPEARMVAHLLSQSGLQNEAKKLFLLAIEIPVTNKDADWYSGCQQIMLTRSEWKDQFRFNTLDDLAECMIKLGQAKEAQKYVQEASELRKKAKFGNNMYLAGRVDAAAGPTTSQAKARMEEEGKLSSNDPEYWLKRATYYTGAGDIQKQAEAYKKAFELTKPVPKMRGKHSSDDRTHALRGYVFALMKQNREQETYNLLLSEMKTAGPKTESGFSAGMLLAGEFRNRIDPDDPIIWEWLDGLDSWEYGGEQLLMLILSNPDNYADSDCGMPRQQNRIKKPSRKLNEYFERAKKMALNKNPEKSYCLAKMMEELSFGEYALPLLEYATQNFTDKYMKNSAASLLIKQYLKAGDVKKAEKVFAEIADTREWRGKYSLLCDLLEYTAKSGDKQAAMKFWTQAANCNLRNFELIQNLAAAGMTDELVTYYDEIAKKLPDSVAPAQAMKILHKKQ